MQFGEKSLSEFIGTTPVKSKTKDDGACVKLTTETLKDQVESWKDTQDVRGNNLNIPPSEPTDMHINYGEWFFFVEIECHSCQSEHLVNQKYLGL